MVSVCTTCKGLQKHLHALNGVQEIGTVTLFWVNTTLPNLRASSSSCRACALLLNGILLHHDRFADIDENDIRVRAESFRPKTGINAQHHLSVELRWMESDDQDECQDDDHEHSAPGHADLKLEFFTDGDGRSPFSAIGQGRQMIDNPLQNSGLATARGLVKTCLESHSTCVRRGKPTTLPKRILDLLTGDDSKSIRLHESEYFQEERRYEHGEYLAFSHIWGLAKNIPKTTLDTLQSHKKNIPWPTLPRAYQEAVYFARALGFRYLWIDSLCLIQDDFQEKLEDSLNMDEIFGNAFLTIAATSASDSSSQPLFQPKTAPFKIQATDNKGSLHKINVREQPTHYSFKAPFDGNAHMNEWELPFNMSEEANIHTPLLIRAWPYTERLLSPRVLHFSKSEMILECRAGYQCECGRIDDPIYDSRPNDQVKQELGRVINETNDRAHANVNGQSNGGPNKLDNMTNQLASTTLTNGAQQDLLRKREEALQLWSYIITEYTARHITYDSDRLIAIASIAKALSPTLQSGYIAGQWTFSTLGLLWYPNDSTRCRRPKLANGQHVPSWSWASIEGSPIFFDNVSAMDLACRASFGPKGKRASAWSPILGEPVELSGAMATEVIFHTPPSPSQQQAPTYILAKNSMTVDFIPDINPPRGNDALQDGDTLICVLVSMTFRSSIVGLVLKPTGNGNTYRRVGRLECYECTPEGTEQEMSEDAEALFDAWFPEVKDMTQLDNCPQRTFTVV